MSVYLFKVKNISSLQRDLAQNKKNESLPYESLGILGEAEPFVTKAGILRSGKLQRPL